MFRLLGLDGLSQEILHKGVVWNVPGQTREDFSALFLFTRANQEQPQAIPGPLVGWIIGQHRSKHRNRGSFVTIALPVELGNGQIGSNIQQLRVVFQQRRKCFVGTVVVVSPHQHDTFVISSGDFRIIGLVQRCPFATTGQGHNDKHQRQQRE